ncbi:hypothetical protein HDE_12573 [Halotydeus destructor]|nr:hypothetical protein HDE_12573 [Halotydeus destructor]
MDPSRMKTVKKAVDEAMQEFEKLKETVKEVDVVVTRRKKQNDHISNEVKELNKSLRKSMSEAEMLGRDEVADDQLLQSLEEEERKLQVELDLINKNYKPSPDSMPALAEEGEDDGEGDGEEPSAEFERELKRTMSNEVDWQYASKN